MNKRLSIITDYVRPHVSSLPSLLKDVDCYVVKMQEFKNADNRDVYGSMIWPEVLICTSKDGAELLRDFLNHKSFQDFRDMWTEYEPYVSEVEIRSKWEHEDIAQYVIERVECLPKYPEVYRISESLMVAASLFPELKFT